MDVISLAVAKKFGMKANVFKYQGSCAFEDLPTQDNEVGDVWNITDEFDLDGKHYEAGTNVAWDGEEWDALSASVDTSIFELNSNKVTTLNASSTNTQYPSAKAVFDILSKTSDISQITDTRNIIIRNLRKGIHMYFPNGSFNQQWTFVLPSGNNVTHNFYGNPYLLIILKDYGEWNSSTDSGGYFAQVIITSYNASGDYGTLCHIYMSVSNGQLYFGNTTVGSYFMKFVTTNPQSFQGVKTFNSLPVSTPVPTQDGQLTNKKYVDDVTATATSAQIQALFGTEGGE